MTERADLLGSISDTIKDYRDGEVPKPTPEHVDRWISQFDEDVQIPLLREIDHVLEKTYFSRDMVTRFFSNQINNEMLAGSDPTSYWRNVSVMDIQQHGHSQTEIRQIFGEAIASQCGLDIDVPGARSGDFCYLDDVLFTGGRIGADLSSWIRDSAPVKATINVLVIASHQLGEWQCINRLNDAAQAAGKDLTFRFWAALRLENRKAYRSRSEVLWPAVIPDDATLQAYMKEETRYPFERREPAGKPAHSLFSSEEGRQLLEREFLLAGMRIRGFCQNPSRVLRPLGYSPFGLGFGSMMVTFRNCPNNTPLALWWGDPLAGCNHPFSKWYPLLPRKTYTPEFDIDDIEF